MQRSVQLSWLTTDLADGFFRAARAIRSPQFSTFAARHALRLLVRYTPEEFAAWQERRLQSAGSGALTGAPPDVEKLRTALTDLYAISEAAGVQVFIMFGTLLGAVRNGGFIPGDKDIDTGIIGRTDFDVLAARLKQSGFGVHFNPRKPSKLGLRHGNGVPIDVKLFEPEEGGTWRWSSDIDHYSWTNRCRFIAPLARMTFLDVDVWAPQQATDFLAWHYGRNWREPTNSYHRLVGRETEEPELKDLILRAAPYIAYKSLRNGKNTPARVIAERLCLIAPDDRLWPALLKLLE